MPLDRYPAGTVRVLLETESVSEPTREVLRERLARPPVVAPRFFATDEFATLRAVCHRLLPQPDRAEPIDLAGEIDGRLATGIGDGWRYAEMPPDGDAYRLALRGLDEVALARYGDRFANLAPDRQDAILAAVQRGAVAGGAWERVAPQRFFEEALAEAVEIYYAHPLAQEEIGYVGMADRPRWDAVGLDALEQREPRPVGDADA